MTTFFNKKEEVIDIELTPFGESLLSVGRFEPTYYAFFDEDILYDASGSAGILEVQNDAEPRIQNNTPALKAQSVYSGIETNLTPLIGIRRYADFPLPLLLPGMMSIAPEALSVFESDELVYDSIPPNIDNNFNFIEPLGAMQLGSVNAPAWNIKVLKGELSGAINYLTSSTSAGIYNNVKRIPQLDFEIKYRVLVGNTRDLNPFGDLATENRVVSRVYEDGSFLYLSESPADLIMVIDEENASADLEYEMEVLLFEDERSSSETPTLTSLNFLKPTVEVMGDILLDEPIINTNTLLDPGCAEYFFLANVDTEIPSEDICPVLGGIKTRGITLNSIPFDCNDVESFGRFDIYGTNAAEEDPCDDES